VAVLCVNGLLVAWMRAATGRLRARLLADPDLPRILADADNVVRSSASKSSRAPRVSAWTEAQRASPHQDLAAGRRARRMSWLWGIPAFIGFWLLMGMIRLPQVPYSSRSHIPDHTWAVVII